MEGKELAADFIGITAGIGQVELIRQVVDKPNPTLNLIPPLGGFGRPSAIIDILVGLAAVGGGIYAGRKKNGTAPTPNRNALAEFLFTYGTAATVTGLISGAFPTVSAVGSMAPEPRIQTSHYVPPTMTQAAVDTSILKQMSNELQRLQGENQQLRTMQTGTYPALIPERSVVDKQLRYGFMEPSVQTNEYIVPGQPTAAARDFGFMEQNRTAGRNRNPLAKVQTIAQRSGFLG